MNVFLRRRRLVLNVLRCHSNVPVAVGLVNISFIKEIDGM